MCAPHSAIFLPMSRLPGPTLSHSPCLAIYCGVLRLRFRSDSFLSFASRFDAGGALSHGQCSAYDRQRSPSFVRANVLGFNFSRVHAGVHKLCKQDRGTRGHSAAQVQAICAAVSLVPALSTAHTLASSLSHAIIASPRPGNLASPPSPPLLQPPPAWRHAAIGATHGTARFRCWRFWRHMNAEQLCGRDRRVGRRRSISLLHSHCTD